MSNSWDGCHSRWGTEWGPFFDRKQVFVVISVDGGSCAFGGGGGGGGEGPASTAPVCPPDDENKKPAGG